MSILGPSFAFEFSLILSPVLMFLYLTAVGVYLFFLTRHLHAGILFPYWKGVLSSVILMGFWLVFVVLPVLSGLFRYDLLYALFPAYAGISWGSMMYGFLLLLSCAALLTGCMWTALHRIWDWFPPHERNFIFLLIYLAIPVYLFLFFVE